jgi:outer membrane protein OmpA-like peptidoglycan-associated protein
MFYSNYHLSSSWIGSYAELDKVIQYLSEHPSFKINILGHTDNVGNHASNLLLSTKRAQAVYDYFLSKGIPSIRLSYKGYGDTQPIVPNDSEEHRALNRRVEIKISKHSS